MRESGFVTQIIFLLVLLIGLVYAKDYFSKLPNANSIGVAKAIPVYPNVKSWDISAKKQLCLYYFNKCTTTPAQITFTSIAYWPEIYSFYKPSLTKQGWETTSHIITSIPTSIVLTNNKFYQNINCTMILKEAKNNLLGLLEDKNTQVFNIQITCE